MRCRERVLAELAAAEEEAEESEAMELEEFDESVDRFDHSALRPMRLYMAYRGGGCVREVGVHVREHELHPRVLASRPW